MRELEPPDMKFASGPDNAVQRFAIDVFPPRIPKNDER